MRLFLAINLPPDTRRDIVEAIAPLREVGASVRWTAETKLHLTMKFLGEQEPSRVEQIATVVRAVTSNHVLTDVSISGVGAFPNSRRPSVLWLGVERSPRLELLAHDLEVACETIGFETEARAFRPHITIGRIRQRPEEDEARKLARAARRITFETEVPVDSVDLMHSVPGGAGYELIASAPLSRRGH